MEPTPLARIRPFDRLGEAERAALAAALTGARFGPGETLLRAGDPPRHLYIVVEGMVQERSGDEVLAVHGPDDAFDARALIDDRSRHDFVAVGEVACQLLPRPVFLQAVRDNPAFTGYFYESLAQRLEQLLAQESRKELAAFMVARIRDAYLRPPRYVAPDTSIRDAALAMKAHKATALLVRRNGTLGIVTARDLQEAVIIQRRPVDGPVGEAANYDPAVQDADDYLFNALLAMTRRDVRRLVIRTGEDVTGVLELTDLLSYFSNHSHLIAVQVDRATTRQELQQASRELTGVVRALHAKGVRVHYISQLVSELNKKVFNKLYALLAPPPLLANSCLLVMGSEGREEQILKTDQDNALILRDGYDCPQLADVTREFTETLLDFGYPRCPGNIMVSNPHWAKPLRAYREQVFRWIEHPSEEGNLEFAIFFDAAAVAGDTTLLEAVRDGLFARLKDHPIFYSRFAKATESFATPLGLFAHFVVEKGGHRDELDIKKGGIFPLVHGVRSLALEQRLRQTNTLERIQALDQLRLFDRGFASELSEAFAFLCTLRLQAGLAKMDRGQPPDNYLNPRQLSTLERELLRDCLKIVNAFKKFIHHHFRLHLLG
ncbi:MAG: DUF294 nucleotidyltransferase-like domain-containing protein [Pseudomonadota bacterium]|nr:DUF294 nucleotidyltransferase-like domain-containing protein [Pseudomonadota bacterium]